MSRTMRAWSRDPNLWKRRSAILCQVGRKQRHRPRAAVRLHRAATWPTDEFFIRKAIGWALRDYAWTDLDTVERWVEANESRLSGLSRREALKNRDALRAGTARGARDPRRRSARKRAGATRTRDERRWRAIVTPCRDD